MKDIKNRITIAIDPITRIEGHLKVEVVVEDGYIVEAKASGGMYRGFDAILKGRTPRDATQIVQRICGVCPVSHTVASSLAIEKVCQVKVPTNGRLARNLMLGGNYLQSNILHFYHLAGQDYFTGPAVAPFLPGYANPDMRLPTSINTQMVHQYIEALRIRQICHELVALFGGRMPHQQGILAGGVTEMSTEVTIKAYLHRLKQVTAFIKEQYLPMVYSIAKYYGDLFDVAHGHQNALCVGGFPLNDEGSEFLYKPGVYIDGQDTVFDSTAIHEDVRYAWFNPAEESTLIGAISTEPNLKKPEAYSFVKAPTYKGKRLEVGPAARMWINNMPISDIGRKYIKEFFGLNIVTTRDFGKDKVFSVMGRNILRAEEVYHLLFAIEHWLKMLTPKEEIFVMPEIPSEGEGIGFVEAPRGALLHYIDIRNYVIAQYEVVSASMWNCSPKDDLGQRSAVEEALIGVAVEHEHSPVNIGRVIRSFDP